MAQGWLGFLEAMKPLMQPIYGSLENVDKIIAQVRNDYANPTYHGYNLMYDQSFGKLIVDTASLDGNPQESLTERSNAV